MHATNGRPCSSSSPRHSPSSRTRVPACCGGCVGCAGSGRGRSRPSRRHRGAAAAESLPTFGATLGVSPRGRDDLAHRSSRIHAGRRCRRRRPTESVLRCAVVVDGNDHDRWLWRRLPVTTAGGSLAASPWSSGYRRRCRHRQGRRMARPRRSRHSLTRQFAEQSWGGDFRKHGDEGHSMSSGLQSVGADAIPCCYPYTAPGTRTWPPGSDHRTAEVLMTVEQSTAPRARPGRRRR